VRRLLLLSTAAIVYGSLYPWRFHFIAGAHPWSMLLHNWPHRFDLWVVRDTVLNIILYIPFGLAAAAVTMRSLSAKAGIGIAVASGAALSATMELLQAYLPGRTSSVADLITNILGALCGASLAVVFAAPIRRLSRSGRKGLNGAAVTLLAAWLCYRLYPFFPAVGRTRLEDGMASLLQPHIVSLVEILIQAGEWLAFAAILDYAWKRMNAAWLAVFMLVLPLQWQLLDRTFSFNELAGAILAAGIFVLTPKSPRAPMALAALGSAVLLRELSPFHLLARPQPFYWIPFAASFDSSRETSVVIIAGKAFDYGALLWLLRRVGVPLMPAACLMAAALFALEWFQRLLPGRTPETTDAVLTLIMAFALWRLDRERHA
jgi:VanZ family protein